jgi:hypothetical protein
MYSIWLILLLIGLLINIINTTNLRCYEDINGSAQLIEHCRACIIYIDIKINAAISQGKMSIDDQPSIQELFSNDKKKYHRHRRRRNTATIVHQKCAREFDGPLYGFDQTHCYCNSNLCNSNIQRCIYEIASKRYFSCYHGSNSSHYSLEIYKKCRSCRIRKEFGSIYHYECKTFGELEQKSDTHCTCQHPMCNQDFTVCQLFQQIPSQPRLNSIHKIFLNSTKIITTTTKLTSLFINSTKNLTTSLLIKNQTEAEFSNENSTSIEITSVSCNDTKQIKTVLIEMKNHANSISSNFMNFYLFLFIYNM